MDTQEEPPTESPADRKWRGERIERILRAAAAVEGEDEYYNMGVDWYEGYADDSDAAPHGIVSANWNNPTLERAGRCLEAVGVEIEWCDSVTSCGDCGRCIQTQPDHHGWRPKFVVGDGYITCLQCMDDSGAWEGELAGLAKEQGVLNATDVDPSEHGYTAIRVLCFGFDGWHSPEKLAKQMKGCDYFLQGVESRQFGSTCLLWVPEGMDLPDEIEGDVGERLDRWT